MLHCTISRHPPHAPLISPLREPPRHRHVLVQRLPMKLEQRDLQLRPHQPREPRQRHPEHPPVRQPDPHLVLIKPHAFSRNAHERRNVTCSPGRSSSEVSHPSESQALACRLPLGSFAHHADHFLALAGSLNPRTCSISAKLIRRDDGPGLFK